MNKELYDSLSEEMQSTYNRFCMPDNLNGLTINSVILSDENKKKVNDFLTETKFKVKFMRYDLQPINRMLNYGASGTGKTYLTKCLAAHFGYELLAIDIANALSSGTAATALESVFELGNHIGKAIIFLDECDAIARDRSDKSVPEDPNVRRANNALFQLLDRMNPECVFIAATNLYTELDPAFVRRFNLKLKFERPSLDNIDDSIRKFIHKDFKYEQNMDTNVKSIVLWYARQYTGLSFYEIKDWVERAEKKVIIEDKDTVLESDIYDLFMESMRIKVGYNDKNEPYLYQ